MEGRSVGVAKGSRCRSWVVEMEDLLSETDAGEEENRWKKHYIYRVPESEWSKMGTDRSAYQPELVSLGPFHHGHSDLHPMEEHKRRAMLHLIKRSRKPLQEFVDAVAEVAEEVMDAYKDLREEKSWQGEKNKDRFIAMMVVDGCFLVEVMMWESLGNVGGGYEDYASNDPVFSEHGLLYVWPSIRHDIIVIENQLPLLLIQRILVLLDPRRYKKRNPGEINKLVLDLLGRSEEKIDLTDKLGLHPLGILHSSFTYTPSPAVSTRELCGRLITQLFGVTLRLFKSMWRRQEECGEDNNISFAEKTGESEDNSSSAEKMREAGIHFKRSATGSFLDVHYEHCGVLSLPCLQLGGNTSTELLNMMAFERLHTSVGNDVTAYMYFMDDIIDTVKDVELLKSREIIRSEMGSDKEVAKLFNDTLNCIRVMSPSSNLWDVRRKVYARCKNPWNTWRANLVDTYFSSPWAFISLVAAVILLVATLVQTYYTVFKH